MKSFKDYNPIAIFLYYALAVIPAMFCSNPVIMSISMVCAVLFRLVKDGPAACKKMWFFLIFPVAGMIVNPIFIHKGGTTLFFINNSPITLEAVMYGLTMGIMIFATIAWFTSFSSIMTTDKLLYIFGSVSPNTALILSMALRYIPLYGQQIKKVRQAQTVTGLYKEDNAIDKIRGGLRIMSVMVSWALENGIITADSMAARGYGAGRRSRFAIFGWRKADVALLVLCAALGVITAACMGIGRLAFEWYPEIVSPGASAPAITAYIAYALLCAIPTVLQMKEESRWRSLQSGI